MRGGVSGAGGLLVAACVSGWGGSGDERDVEHRVIRLTDPDLPAACEVSIALDPARPDRVLSTFMHPAPGATRNHAYSSDDGGRTWITVPGPNPHGRTQGDDAVVFGPDGTAYWSCISFVGIRDPDPPRAETAITVVRSDDGGRCWSEPVAVVESRTSVEPFEDKPWLAVDGSDSPHRGNLYLAWTRFDRYGSEDPDDHSHIWFARSTDGARHFEPPLRISDRPGDCTDGDDTVEGAVPCVGPEGQVYVVWAGPRGLEFDRSLDGGRSFGEDRVIGPMVGGWDVAVEGLDRVNGMPVTGVDLSSGPDRGSLYLNFLDARHGDLDVFVMVSRDEGQSWSTPLRVGDGRAGDGAEQFFTWMAVDATDGSVNVASYDRTGRRGTATGLCLARSTDGGRRFATIPIDQEPFELRPGGFFGDYLGVAAAQGRVAVGYAWYDGDRLAVSCALFDFVPGSLEAR